METKYLYLLVNIFAFFPPFVLSFDRKVAYFRRWKYLMPALGIMAVLFIGWDIIFTYLGVWKFNPDYLTGIEIINLPIEEWLFFLTIPFASVFIYDCIKAYFPHWQFREAGIRLARLLAILLLLVGLICYARLYTSVTFVLLSGLLFYLGYKRAGYLGRFFLSYLIILIPFFMTNGILTGSGIENEVVWYNAEENLGIRLITIPFEDVFYGMLLILGNVALYEHFQQKR
jgi:lycopene cyclase domain-containing protein